MLGRMPVYNRPRPAARLAIAPLQPFGLCGATRIYNCGKCAKIWAAGRVGFGAWLVPYVEFV